MTKRQDKRIDGLDLFSDYTAHRSLLNADTRLTVGCLSQFYTIVESVDVLVFDDVKIQWNSFTFT